MSDHSDHNDARKNDAAMLELIRSIKKEMGELKDTLNRHISTEPQEWARVLSELMTRAFPEGDPEGHRRFHEAIIKKAEKEAEFWADMTYKLKKWGLIGFTLWALKTLIEAGALWIQNGAHLK